MDEGGLGGEMLGLEARNETSLTVEAALHQPRST